MVESFRWLLRSRQRLRTTYPNDFTLYAQPVPLKPNITVKIDYFIYYEPVGPNVLGSDRVPTRKCRRPNVLGSDLDAADCFIRASNR